MKNQKKGLEMTSYITTRIKMSGSQKSIDTLLERHSTGGKLDFEKIAPTPNEFNTKPPKTDTILEEKLRPLLENDELSISEVRDLLIKYEGIDAKEWRRMHWGTEENAKLHVLNRNETSFVTVQNHPLGAMIFLCVEYPEVMFEVEYASENIGKDCGKYVMSQGNPATYLETLVDMSTKPQAKEWARELVFGENSPLKPKRAKEGEICRT